MLVATSLSVFLAVVVLIVALRPLAQWLDHVDRPGGRKRHARAVPLCGGIAVVPAVVAAGLSVSAYSGMAGLAGGLVAMMVLGVVDDRVHVPVGVRMTVEALAVVVLMCLLHGVVIESLGSILGGNPLLTGGMAFAFTVFAVVGLMNGINMIDGVDGVAGGFSAIVFGTLLVGAIATGSDAVGILAFLLAAVLAFLVFNLRTPWRRRADVFLGDAGSLSLGFALTWFAVDLSQGTDAVFRPITMAWIFALPILDTLYMVVRRASRGEHPFRPDHYHFHHLLLGLGLRPGQAAAAWLLLAAVLAGVGVAGELLQVQEATMFYAFNLVLIAYFIALGVTWRRLESAQADVGGDVVAEKR